MLSGILIGAVLGGALVRIFWPRVVTAPETAFDEKEFPLYRTTARGEIIEVNSVETYLREAKGDVSLGDVIEDDER